MTCMGDVDMGGSLHGWLRWWWGSRLTWSRSGICRQRRRRLWWVLTGVVDRNQCGEASIWVGADVGIYVAFVGGVGISVGGHDCRTHFNLAQREQLARGSMMSGPPTSLDKGRGMQCGGVRTK